MVEEGGVDITERDGAGNRLGTDPVGGADHLPMPHPAAGEEGAVDLRPVVAADDVADLRRPPELPPHHHGTVVGEPALVEILDERRERLIKDGEILRLPLEDRIARAAVPVPLAVIERHDADTSLDQPPGDEHALGHARGAVFIHEHRRIAGAIALDNTRILLGEIEGIGQLRRRQQPEGALGEDVHPAHVRRHVDIAAEPIDAFQEAAAILEAVERDPLENELVAGRPQRPKRGVGSACKPGPRFVVGPVRAGVAKAHKRRRGGCGSPEEARDHRSKLRPASGRLSLPRVAAVKHLRRVMVGLIADERTDEGVFVGDFREVWKGLADLDPGDIRLHRPPRPGKLFRGLGLEVEHVLVRRPPHEVDHDHRFRARPAPRSRVGGEDRGERPTSRCAPADGGKRPDAKEAAARQAVAELLRPCSGPRA